MRALVVPSNRGLTDFFASWEGKGGWDTVIIIEDGPQRTFDVQADYHYSWQEIENILGEDAWIISRQDSAIRCFGFLAAYHLGAEYVLTLDDDCYPCEGYTPLMDWHVSVMTQQPAWTFSVPCQRTRGVPYKNMGVLKDVVANVGLWTNVGDWDSVQQRPHGYFQPPKGSRIVPDGQFIPFCGMNVCLERRALPLFYFPLMGLNSPYARFDDIWAGVAAKRRMDWCHWHMAVGEPFVEHRRASDPEANRRKEAPGIEANESYWEWLGRRDYPGTDPYILKIERAYDVWRGFFVDRFKERMGL